jgi:hypothetical protein
MRTVEDILRSVSRFGYAHVNAGELKSFPKHLFVRGFMFDTVLKNDKAHRNSLRHRIRKMGDQAGCEDPFTRAALETGLDG